MYPRTAWTLAPLIMAASLLSACAPEDAGSDGDTVFLEDFQGNGLRLAEETLQAASPTDPTPGHLAFAFSDFRSHTPSDTNTLSAPFDLQQLHAMTALGAAGTTLDAFSSATGFDLSQTSTFAGLSLWDQTIGNHSGVERISYLWGEQYYRFAEGYLQAQASLYGPRMQAVDFLTTSYTTETEIEYALHDTLSLTEIGDRTRLVTALTTKINVPWPGSLTVEPLSARFGPHEAQRWVDMLRLSGQFMTYEEADYQAVEIPLDGDLSMLIIIPAEGKFDVVRNGLDADFWQALLGKLNSAAMEVYVPQFTLAREVTDGSLPDLGVALVDEASDPNQAANFSPVNNAGFLHLEPVRQHITLNLGEAGLSSSTSTAAVHTATEDEPSYLFPEFGFVTGPTPGGEAGFVVFTEVGTTSQPCFYPPNQRPFLFALYAKGSNTLLHLGQVRELDGPEVDPDWYVPNYTSCGDSPLVDIYRYTGSTQCDFGSGISIEVMRQELVDAGITYTNYYTSSDGNAYPSVCGGATGEINVFTIHEKQVPLAETLGFKQLSELNLL